MYCPKCGAQIDDGAKFCTNCGASLLPPPPAMPPNAPAQGQPYATQAGVPNQPYAQLPAMQPVQPPQAKPKKKRGLIIALSIIGAIIAVAAIIVGILFATGFFKPHASSAYLPISQYSYDGYSGDLVTVDYDFDNGKVTLETYQGVDPENATTDPVSDASTIIVANLDSSGGLEEIAQVDENGAELFSGDVATQYGADGLPISAEISISGDNIFSNLLSIQCNYGFEEGKLASKSVSFGAALQMLSSALGITDAAMDFYYDTNGFPISASADVASDAVTMDVGITYDYSAPTTDKPESVTLSVQATSPDTTFDTSSYDLNQAASLTYNDEGNITMAAFDGLGTYTIYQYALIENVPPTYRVLHETQPMIYNFDSSGFFLLL